MKWKNLILILIILVVFLVAWAPWLTPSFVNKAVTHSLGRRGTELTEITNFERKPFGVTAHLKFHNSFSKSDFEKDHFITFYGKVIGLGREQ